MKDANKGQLLIISGPAGSGKGTTVQKILELYPDRYALSVSCTTRSPRPGEIDGVHYHYISGEEFERRIAEDQFLEYARYVNGNNYGTPADYVEEMRCAGKNVILEIDVQGGMQVKRKAPDAILIMVAPPDVETLEKRLRGRGTEKEEEILKRLNAAHRELSHIPVYDYLVLLPQNDVITPAVTIDAIVRAEACKAYKFITFSEEFYKTNETKEESQDDLSNL